MTTQTKNFSLYNFLLSDSYNEDSFKIPTEEDLFCDKLNASDVIANHFYNEFLHDSVIDDFKKLVLNKYGEVDTIENEYKKTGILKKHGLENVKKAKAFYVFEDIETETYKNQTHKDMLAFDFYHDYFEKIRDGFSQTEYHSFYSKQDEEIIFDDETIFDYMYLYHNDVTYKEYIETLAMIYLNPKYTNVIIDKFLDRLIENTQTIKTKKGKK